MDNQVTSAQHIFRYKSFQINKSQKLGRGAYGAVYKAKCDQLPCAAKLLHPTILDPMDPGADKIMERFKQECALLESIRHPNVVQYLAMTVDPESRLPVLLMELLDESLTKLLERSQRSLAYYIQVDICHDIALAIAYLHSNSIIHRDLSSNNVLIIAGRRAKVSDFGMSKLIDAVPTLTPITVCPGTLAYMPPEVLREPPRYTKKLDCFSEGVIMVQVCTRLWPEPGPRTQTVKDSRSPMGIIEIPVSETERRKNHIDMIDPGHPLLPIAIDCLCFQEVKRPSSDELCQRLADLKESTQYTQNIKQQQNEMQAKDDQISVLTQQLHESATHTLQGLLKQSKIDRQSTRHLKRNMVDQESPLQERKLQVQEKDSMESELLQQPFLVKEHKTNHSLQRGVEQLQQLSQQVQHLQTPTAPLDAQQKDVEEQQKQSMPNTKTLTLIWRGRGKAPLDMSRGAAVVDGEVAYFVGSDGQACSYNSTNKKWKKFPKCTYQQCSLAVINGHLTAIGGYKDSFIAVSFSNKLVSLLGGENWKEIFPPMPTKREGAVVITLKEHLIVAGGAIGVYIFTTIKNVEVMDTKSLVWSTVADLPHPYSKASTTICGDHLYMLGGLDDKGNTMSVLTCSLTELLRSSSTSPSVWHRIADAPVNRSTSANVNGELFAFGGLDEHDNPTPAIHKYNPTINSWSIIGYMPTVKFDCLVAIFPQHNEMMLVGGCTRILVLNNIEFARFS